MRLSLNRYILAFFVVQVTVDCFQSVSLFPFIHYGMFSAVISKPDSQTLYVVVADGNILRPQDFNAVRWEMIQQPLLALDRQMRTADYAPDRNKLHQGLDRAGLKGLYDRVAPNLVNAPDLPARFPGWYRDYLSKLLGRPVQTLSVDREQVRYSGGRMVPFQKENWIKIG